MRAPAKSHHAKYTHARQENPGLDAATFVFVMRDIRACYCSIACTYQNLSATFAGLPPPIPVCFLRAGRLHRIDSRFLPNAGLGFFHLPFSCKSAGYGKPAVFHLTVS